MTTSTNACQLMTDAEVVGCCGVEDDAGFGGLSTERGYLPLAAMDVQTKIAGLVAHTSLRQTFVNAFDAPIEATYIFPLPSRAAVTGFRMEVAGRVVDGVIKERGQARADYDQAIADGHRAAITEEERSGVFTVRVGNIMPGERAAVRLTLTGPLPYADGEATFRFPLVVAPRYIPGTPLPGDNVGQGVESDTNAVPDASRISPPVLLPGFPNPVQLSLGVTVDPLDMQLSSLRSSLHAVVEDDAVAGARSVRLGAAERLDRDFVLRFQLGADDIGTALATRPDDEGDEGTFQLTLVPPVAQSKALKARDVVFVLDRSGSMGGWKIVAARRATARMVDTLSDRDRFSVLAFDHSILRPPSFESKLVPATDRNRFRAVEFLAGLTEAGGTEMAQPLTDAADMLAGGYDDRDRVLVLVTDGQVGNEDQILRKLAVRLKNVRVFTLGIDQAVNEGFLRRLAAAGGGACELVESEDRLDEVMDRVHMRIATPVVSELSLHGEGIQIEADSIVPARLPALFAGTPLVVSGRYKGAVAPNATIDVRGSQHGAAWSESVPARAIANEAIGAIWARGAVRDLEDRYVLGRGDRSALEKRIIDTSIRFHVLSRFTAFVAVDHAEKVNPGGDVHKVVQPVDAPAGWDMLGAPPAPPAAAPGGGMMRTMMAPAAAAMPQMPMPTSASGYGGGRFAAAPKRKRAVGSAIKGAIGGLFRREAKEEAELAEAACDDLAPEEPGIDLSAYRRRARALVDSGIGSLAALATELEALIQALESVGAGDDELQPLRDVLDELRAHLSGARPVPNARERVLEALTEFADGGEAANANAPSGRGAFWK